MPNATALTSNSSLLTNPPQTCNPFIGADALSTSSLQFLQQMQQIGLQQQLLQGTGSYDLPWDNVPNKNTMFWNLSGMNGAQLDTSSNSMPTGSAATHASLLQPISMQNLLAMACMGQSPLSPSASSQPISTAQLGTASTPLCMLPFYSSPLNSL